MANTKKKCDCEDLEQARDRYNDMYYGERSRHRGTRRRARLLKKQLIDLRGYLEQAALAIEKLCKDNGDPEMAAVVSALRWQAFPPKGVK